MWNFLRWIISFILLTNSAFFFRTVYIFARDLKAHPDDYKNTYGRLSYPQIFAIFILAGVACGCAALAIVIW